MSTQTRRLIRHAPPLWMTLTAAAIVAALLLGSFITILHDHIRHSAEVRRMFGQPAPHAGSARHVVATAAVAGQVLPAAPLR
ncbi:hypothetical protein [Roseateles asaccharophilus]|uniref:Uncharacterized protein n=1 Tax=Roseateles asaccharophilus TaxID=582607 RepID=A0ABU2A9C5_9BURK|nr:hypothetical protein [Roseateles asaccharophilus]MDR7333802.1 hypothetical protein [Roseateles asaccharophilus]